MDIEALNAEHAIDSNLRIVEGQGGLPMVEIENELATATISIYAGQVLSYRPAEAAQDLLFVSDRAYYAPGKAIKGGIPVCWPWFGADPEGKGRPAHGFVRSTPWTLLGTEALDGGAIRVVLGIADDGSTRDVWPNHFNLRLEATIGETLALDLVTVNPQDRPFSITQALHTYFNVGDITRVRVLGLEDCRYIDKAANGNDLVHIQQGAVTVCEEVNRIYESVAPVLTIEDPALDRRIRIESRNSTTCIVWNPWVEVARSMGDLDDSDYERLLCVETANAASEVIECPAGAEVSLGVEYRILSL